MLGGCCGGRGGVGASGERRAVGRRWGGQPLRVVWNADTAGMRLVPDTPWRMENEGEGLRPLRREHGIALRPWWREGQTRRGEAAAVPRGTEPCTCRARGGPAAPPPPPHRVLACLCWQRRRACRRLMGAKRDRDSLLVAAVATTAEGRRSS